MKKIIGVIFALIGLVSVFSACGGDTYADKLEAQSKAIDRFIRDNNIEILYDYPAKHKFAANQFYKDPATGIYIQVIDSGNNEKPTTSPFTDIILRYDTIYNMLNNEVEAAPNWQTANPMSFTYGNANTYFNNVDMYDVSYYLLSQACVRPLEFGIGNKSAIKLIIPFDNGSAYQQSSYIPFYYSRIEYSFIVDLTEE